MKFRHSINAISAVSFIQQVMMNPVDGQPTGEKRDLWEEIQNVTAKGLEELQGRIDALEERLASLATAENMMGVLEAVASQVEKAEAVAEKAEVKAFMESDRPAPIPIEAIIKRRGRKAKVRT